MLHVDAETSLVKVPSKDVLELLRAARATIVMGTQVIRGVTPLEIAWHTRWRAVLERLEKATNAVLKRLEKATNAVDDPPLVAPDSDYKHDLQKEGG
jgi:hypothetical protein